MSKLLSVRRLLPLGVAVVLTLLPSLASPGPVNIIAKAVATRATTVAATFAVAHTPAGTGGPTAGACFDADFSILGVSSSSCSNADFFPHATPPPTGNDSADANASAVSALFGGGGVNTKPTIIGKGDFAAAGAFARTAANVSIDAAVPAGAPAAVVTFTLPGGDTYTARKDPETSFYAYVLSDLGEEQFDITMMTHDVMGLSFDDYLPTSVLAGLMEPVNIYFALLLEVDGGAGTINVLNFGSLVTTPLTAADFANVSTPDEARFHLIGDRDYSFDIPAQGGPGTSQRVTFDAAEVHVGSAAEPATLALAACALGIAACVRRRTPARRSLVTRP
jgi:hypothetical protein